MPEEIWTRPWLPTRVDRDPGKLALLIPGGGYSPERPLLHFARAVFMKLGWTTQELWWSARPPLPGESEVTDADWVARRDFANAEVCAALDRESADQIVLVGKSLGTFAAKTAADRGLAGIWLTPVLTDERLVADLYRASKPFLLVGGTADQLWKSELAHSFGQPLYEAPNADHGMETGDDPVNSAEILKQVTIAMDKFASAL